METQIKQQIWGMRSVSYWLTLLLALGIIFIGVRFILQPQVGAIGYGISFTNMHDEAYGKVKGIRDMVSGIVLLPLLYLKMRRATAWVITTATLTPLVDFLIILSANGAGDMQHLSIHGGTALVMMVNSILLFKKG
ncbi:DUF4267 domain-containing protein [Mucilaginibacter lutimaris]|uniref:DUF4267 domain-containing protein n=1 Tax=Mucilaginibacter lutimaris TaxID=931629 RepID=A0ABW2ZKB2_9SPHI